MPQPVDRLRVSILAESVIKMQTGISILLRLLGHHVTGLLLCGAALAALRSEWILGSWVVFGVEGLLFGLWVPSLVAHLQDSTTAKLTQPHQVGARAPSLLHVPAFVIAALSVVPSLYPELGALFLLLTALLVGRYVAWRGRLTEALASSSLLGSHLPALELLVVTPKLERLRAWNSNLTLFILVLIARFIGFGVGACWELLWALFGSAPGWGASGFLPGAGLMWIVLYCIWLAWMGRLPQHRLRYTLSEPSDLKLFAADSPSHQQSSHQQSPHQQTTKQQTLDQRTLHNRAGVRLGEIMRLRGTAPSGLAATT